MPILLSDEEIEAVIEKAWEDEQAKGYYISDEDCIDQPIAEATARAQLKNVVEWLNKDCTEHPKTSDSYNKTYYLARSDCPECMEALKKEAGLT